MTVVVMMVVMMAPAVSAVPASFRGRLLRIVLDRRGGAGIAQRHRLGALDRSGQHEQCADCGKAQNSRNVHAYSPWGHWLSRQHRAADRVGRFAATQIEKLE
jgi:hypothetical protein